MTEAVAEAVASEPAATPANVAQETPKEPQAEPKQDRTFTQAELDEIIRKKDAKRLKERDELRRENEVLRKLALEKAEREQRQEQRQEKPAETGEPKRENFATYEEYLEAKAEFKATKAVDERLAKRREEEARNRTEAETRKVQGEFRAKAEKFAESVEDFHEVMSESTAKLTQAMADAIVTADDAGPKIAYYLAKNPEEAERIAGLAEHLQAREIWKLEAKASEPVKKPSKAPAPIDPVKGKGGVSDSDEPDPADTAKWVAWRNKQVAKARRG